MVQELLSGKKGTKPLSQHYAKTTFEEPSTLFPISTDAKKMPTQCE